MLSPGFLGSSRSFSFMFWGAVPVVGLQFVGSSRGIATGLLMVSGGDLDADFSLAL